MKEYTFSGKKLAALLEEKKLTPKNLANSIDKTEKFIQDLLSDKVKPAFNTVKAIAKVLEIYDNYLFEDPLEIDLDLLKDVSDTICNYIWKILKDSSEFDFSIREETITESALLKFKRAIRRNFYIQQKDTTEERYDGSDWEWFIIRGGKWLAFRVQAKKLKTNSQSAKYERLHYEPKGINQCESLINKAWDSNMIPLYSFYNYLPEETLNRLSLIPKIDNPPLLNSAVEQLKVDFRPLGWSFCFADYVYPSIKLNHPDNFIDIIKKSNNFAHMFLQDLEVVAKEYNDLDNDNRDNPGGNATKPDPSDPPIGGNGIPSDTSDGINKKEKFEQKEYTLLKQKKDREIKVRELDELPIYAKRFLSEHSSFKFGSYSVDEEEKWEAAFVVYSILEYHPNTAGDGQKRIEFNPLEVSKNPSKEDNSGSSTESETEEDLKESTKDEKSLVH